MTCQGLDPWTWYGLSIYNSLYTLLLLSLFDYVRIIKLIFTVHCLVVLYVIAGGKVTVAYDHIWLRSPARPSLVSSSSNGMNPLIP